MSDAREVLRLEAITRSYGVGATKLEVLRGLDLALRGGEIVALVGPSGSGKSTLLHIAGLLDTPTSGRVMIEGQDCARLSDAARTGVRRLKLGFVYQFHHLLPEFTALENVLIPQMVAGVRADVAAKEAERLLAMLGLGERLKHRPGELSGGEQQRVAIARGLANKPLVLLADEPTGNLDPKTAEMVFAHLMEIARAQGTAALIATHNLDLAARMSRVLVLHEGRLLDASTAAD